ncbi:MAG: hypothetical protein ACKO7R_12510 [Pseudanabaena sp.]
MDVISPLYKNQPAIAPSTPKNITIAPTKKSNSDRLLNTQNRDRLSKKSNSDRTLFKLFEQPSLI